MADRRRIVTIGSGGAVAVALDLEDGVVMRSERDSFRVTPGAATAVTAVRQTRLGGSRRVGERVEDGTVAWTAFVQGATADAALASAENLLALLRDPRSDLYYEWRPEGATRSTYYQVVGSATVSTEYRWIVFAQNRWLKVTVEVPVGPVVRYDPMDIFDPFDLDTRTDYTFDAGVLADLSVASGQVSGAGTLTTERRLRHTARGYHVLDGQGTLHHAPGSTITSYKAGVIARAVDAANYVDVYVDDNATNSRLRIDTVIASARNNRFTANLPARLVNGVEGWTRGRVEGPMVYAEHHSTAPGPASPPLLLGSYQLTSAEQAALAAGGQGGWDWIPQQAGAAVYDFEWLPFTYAPFAGAAPPPNLVDDFSSNTIANYTFDAGAATMAVAGGVLTESTTAEKRFYYTLAATNFDDVQVTWKFTNGTTLPSGASIAPMAKRLDASNSVFFNFNVAGGTGTLTMFKRDAGSNVALNADVVAPTVVLANSTWWVRLRIRGNVLIGEVFTSQPPVFGGTPNATSIAVLGGADAVKFGTGVVGGVGMRTALLPTDVTFDDFDARSLRAGGLLLPDVVQLGGPIPGTAPALIDVSVTPFSDAAPPIWPLVGWTPRAAPCNLCWNGDFEEDTNGWALGSGQITGLNSATSITRDTLTAKFGTANGAVVTTAGSADQGVSFTVYRRFKAGVPVTFVVWARSATSAAVRLRMGTGVINVGDNVTGSGSPGLITLTTTYQQLSLTWTPTADRDVASFFIGTNVATAMTFNIDGAVVYEGAVAPTLGRHGEGAGAAPPFGVIEAEAVDTGDLTGWSVAAVSTARMGLAVYDASVVGAETYTAGWWLDPALLTADDFSAGEVDVEFWCRATLNTLNISPRMVLSARPEWGTAFGAERFTSEFGAAGRALTKPSTSFAWRATRLGTLTFPVDPTRPARWKLWLTATMQAGSTGDFGIDYLVAVPIRRRVAGATGKPNDATYPDFVGSNAQTVRTITSDLAGLVARPPFAGQPVGGGVAGAPLELSLGAVDLLVKLSSLVPDDPTSDATSEVLTHCAAVHLAVTPRAYLIRGG